MSDVPPITSDYLAPRPGGPHRGIDFGVGIGTLLCSPDSGMGWSDDEPSGYGLHTRVRNSLGEVLIQGHLSSTTLPRGKANAVQVRAGEPIAHSGNSGSSTGPHVHLEARAAGYTPTNRVWRRPSSQEITNTFDPEEQMTDAQMDKLKAHIVQAVRVTVAAVLFGTNTADAGAWLRDDVAPWNGTLPNLRALNAAVADIDAGSGSGASADDVINELAARLQA